MRKIAELPLGSNKVIVRELSVPQVISIIESMGREESQQPTAIDWFHGNEHMSQEILEIIIEEKLDELMNDDVGQEELKKVYEKALELNPSLSVALTNMRKAGEAMGKSAELLLQQLSQTQSSSSIGDTTESGSTGSPSSLTQLMNSLVQSGSDAEQAGQGGKGGETTGEQQNESQEADK